MSAPRGLFVTGTDTGVGKTLVAAGLLRLALRRGLAPNPSSPSRPGATPTRRRPPSLAGCRAADRPGRGLHARAAVAGGPAPSRRRQRRRIDLIAVADRAYALGRRGGFLLVEGAGGLLVPYAGGETTADFAARIGLPLLVVGRTALGTINHIALTLAEAARRGFRSPATS